MPVLLPDDIVLDIFASFTPNEASLTALLHLRTASKRFSTLSEHPSVWTGQLERWTKSFPPPATNAQQEYRRRYELDKTARRLITELVRAVHGRRALIDRIAELGPDVIQALEELGSSARSNRGTALAVQYWTEQALGTIRREQALRIWASAIKRFHDVDLVADVQLSTAPFLGADPEHTRALLRRLCKHVSQDPVFRQMPVDATLSCIVSNIYRILYQLGLFPSTSDIEVHFLHALLARHPFTPGAWEPTLGMAHLFSEVVVSVTKGRIVARIAYFVASPVLMFNRQEDDPATKARYFDFRAGRFETPTKIFQSYSRDRILPMWQLQPVTNGMAASLLLRTLSKALATADISTESPSIGAARAMRDQLGALFTLLNPTASSSLTTRRYFKWDNNMLDRVYGELLGKRTADQIRWEDPPGFIQDDDDFIPVTFDGPLPAATLGIIGVLSRTQGQETELIFAVMGFDASTTPPCVLCFTRNGIQLIPQYLLNTLHQPSKAQLDTFFQIPNIGRYFTGFSEDRLLPNPRLIARYPSFT